METVGIEFLDSVYKFGVLPLLLIAVSVLWNRQGKLENQVNKLHEDQKAELKSHSEEVKGLQQETISALMSQQKFHTKTIELLQQISKK